MGSHWSYDLNGKKMADTIESFITKLKSEGVEQGKQQAELLRDEAKQESDRILNDAKTQAEKILSDANAEAESVLARGRTELELAARDATLKLLESLEKAMAAVLASQVESQLSDSEFLKGMIRSILERFVDADIDSYAPVKINVAPEMREQLCDWALGQLRISMQDDAGGFDFKDNLRQAGFEFSLHGATIEVSRESVVEVLMQLVGPKLREIVKQANQSGEGV